MSDLVQTSWYVDDSTRYDAEDLGFRAFQAFFILVKWCFHEWGGPFLQYLQEHEYFGIMTPSTYCSNSYLKGPNLEFFLACRPKRIDDNQTQQSRGAVGSQEASYFCRNKK